MDPIHLTLYALAAVSAALGWAVAWGRPTYRPVAWLLTLQITTDLLSLLGRELVLIPKLAADPSPFTCLYMLGSMGPAEAELRALVERAAPGAHSGITGRAVLARVLLDGGAVEEAHRAALRVAADARATVDHLAAITAAQPLARSLVRLGAAGAAEREFRALADAGGQAGVMQGEFRLALAEVRLAQGDVAEALSLVRALGEPGAAGTRGLRLRARPTEVKARLAAGERAAARALIEEGLREIRAIAARIGDEALREAFLTRSPLSTPLFQLAEAEGLAEARRPGRPP